ncbi:MAG: RES family NAD+ phosphorylase [Allosphingosinicella sp.]
MMEESEEVVPEKVSLCLSCAKHPELSALVGSDSSEGVCGVCGGTENVFNPERFEAVRNLMRALIRLHFDEQEYNHHWGGTSIHDILLAQENPIVEIARPQGFPDELIDRITWEGGIYPEYDQGICLYAGNDEVAGRLLQFSIPETICSELRDIELRLDRENFHAVEPAMEALVSRIANEIESEVAEGSLWYRGRIGYQHAETHFSDMRVTRVVTPYKGAAMSALPPPQASAGRMNRLGVSVLYVASEIETALAEIRPHPGHTISVGGFRPSRRLRIAQFDVPISNFASSDKRLDEFAIIYHVDTLLSLPVIPEERHRYAATQLLSDILIRRGFDGISYRSSVGAGKNLCVFDPSLFVFDETASAVRHVDRIDYTFSEVAMVPPTRFALS